MQVATYTEVLWYDSYANLQSVLLTMMYADKFDMHTVAPLPKMTNNGDSAYMGAW